MDLVALIKEKVHSAVQDIYGIDVDLVHVENPDNPEFGDFSTNISFLLSKNVKQPPMTIAESITEKVTKNFEQDSPFSKITFITPGFINFHLSNKYLLDMLLGINGDSDKVFGYGNSHLNEKVIVEYTDPNPFKVFHIGHLMPNVIGESIARMYESQGAEVKRANYQGDVGMHVAKSIWGMQQTMDEQNLGIPDLEKKPLKERIEFLGKCYVRGASAYKEDSDAVEEIKELNAKIYAKDSSILDLYEAGRTWSLGYFETLYKRLGTKFDFYYFERDSGEKGLEISKQLLNKGTFEESDGAIVFRADKYNLHTRVFVNSQGLPTYESKDLGLAVTKYADFSYDTSIIVTDNEVDNYFKVVLKALYLYHPELAVRTRHISHGQLRLKSGRMSSRTGKVIAGDVLMNTVRSAVMKKMENPDEVIADQIGIAAIKYGILKNSIGMNIIYDEEAWLSMTGDTGPYLQYTAVRANSILDKSEKPVTDLNFNVGKVEYEMEDKEVSILRIVQRYPEIVKDSLENIQPNKICTYLNTLAREFNAYYSDVRILETEDSELLNFRLSLVSCVYTVISNGLDVLGISVPPRM